MPPSPAGRILPRALRLQQPLQQSRPFFSLPNLAGASSSEQTITASRTLPYPAPALYDLIADVDAYSSFLPHCHASRVTEWSEPLTTTLTTGPSPPEQQPPRRWPRKATLTVGYGPLTQTYTSRLYCHPSAHIVEAVSGRAGPTLTPTQLRDIGLDADAEAARGRRSRSGDTFESLVTRWIVIPASPPSPPAAGQPLTTRVELGIRYKFANPMFQLATGQFGEEIAKLMIEAFERRAREMLGGANGARGRS